MDSAAYLVRWTRSLTGENGYVGETADDPKVVASRAEATEFPELEARRLADHLASFAATYTSVEEVAALTTASPSPRWHTLVADPPWKYDTDGTHLRSSANHRPRRAGATMLGAASRTRYGEMSLPELKALPVAEIAEDDAHLYLWTTNAMMVEAHELARAWGFIPKTILTWVKPSLGLGAYFRNSTEHVIFARRGKLNLLVKDARTDFTASVRGHSQKPDAFFDLVERCSPGPYMELFSRRARLGWDTWGDEALHGTELIA